MSSASWLITSDDSNDIFRIKMFLLDPFRALNPEYPPRNRNHLLSPMEKVLKEGFEESADSIDE